MTDPAGEITRILREGREDAGEAILPHVYEELRSIARQRMARERSDHTLQATALVHEAYGRLLGGAAPAFEDRAHFYAAAAQAMQRVLVDHARAVGRQKRGGDRVRVTLGGPDAPVEFELDRVLELDEALATLAAADPRAAEVTRLRFLAGLTVEETARALGISERSVAREWNYAKAKLTDLLGGADA
jgi:RNA polymerase sigma factor (TIGR02999 family)